MVHPPSRTFFPSSHIHYPAYPLLHILLLVYLRLRICFQRYYNKHRTTRCYTRSFLLCSTHREGSLYTDDRLRPLWGHLRRTALYRVVLFLPNFLRENPLASHLYGDHGHSSYCCTYRFHFGTPPREAWKHITGIGPHYDRPSRHLCPSKAFPDCPSTRPVTKPAAERLHSRGLD